MGGPCVFVAFDPPTAKKVPPPTVARVIIASWDAETVSIDLVVIEALVQSQWDKCVESEIEIGANIPHGSQLGDRKLCTFESS